MASIKLVPEDGGEAIGVTEASTVIGRGAFLKVIDKRVSRSHALLELIDGKLHLTPTHTNPCFFRRGGTGPQQVLKRDVRQALNEGDMFGLLPDQLFYTISYGDASFNGINTTNGERKETVKKEAVQVTEKKAKAVKVVRKEESEEDEAPALQKKPSVRDIVFADGQKMAAPLTKRRPLPAWMIRLANTSAPPPKKKAAPPAKKATPVKRAAPSRPKTKNEGYRFDESEEEEDSRPPPKKKSRKPKADDDEYEEDWEEEKPKQRKGPQKRGGGGGRGEDDSSARRPRRAATKSIGSYEEDFQLLEFDESDDAPVKGDSDSDFRMDYDGDSGSDWDHRSPKKPARKPAGRTPGRGARGKGRKTHRPSYSEEDDYFEESEEEYVPRPSKRRGGGGGASQRRQKAANSDEEDGDDDEVTTPKKARKGRQAKTPRKRDREACYYGTKCYRKNPDHFKQFSHPGDSDYVEDDDEPARGRKKDVKKTSKPEPVKAPAKKKKRSKSDEEEDDDGLPNTYDYNDSFIDDAGLSSQSQSLSQRSRHRDDDVDDDSEDDEEDIAELSREAKSFIRNKKMMKPVSGDV